MTPKFHLDCPTFGSCPQAHLCYGQRWYVRLYRCLIGSFK